MAYQSKTYSLSDEVIAWLGTLRNDYGSVNKGLLAVIAGAGNSAVVKADATGESEHVADNRPKNAYCKHCGNKFAGPRFATICSECKSSGHTLTPAECPACNEGREI